MNALKVIIICVAVVLYIQLAAGFGYYMFLLTSKKIKGANEKQIKQIIRYSIIAGVAFPVTLAIIIASRAAERR